MTGIFIDRSLPVYTCMLFIVSCFKVPTVYVVNLSFINDKYSLAKYMAICKAFDCVNHQLLLTRIGKNRYWRKYKNLNRISLG